MSVITFTRRRRAMTSVRARNVRASGHQAEDEFAELIGGKVYSKRSGRKKDVVDKYGDLYSVKSGEKKWQIFLYGLTRFKKELHFQGAEFFIKCIESFPSLRSEYLSNKIRFKIILQLAMQNLRMFLAKGNNKRIFLDTAFLNNGEVDYLTVKHNGIFHIFDGNEAMNVINNSTVLENSKAIRSGEMDSQKVTFKLIDTNKTIGEIEMRNDSEIHYRQVKFWMDKVKTLSLLQSKIKSKKKVSERIICYGIAVRKFS